jgi:hypothetical protein
MLCPIMSDSEHTEQCYENCGFWNKEKGKCAVLVISNVLSTFLDRQSNQPVVTKCEDSGTQLGGESKL